MQADNVSPEVSVIIPVYQDQEKLNVCLASLLEQTLLRDRYEVIVVDNGSNPPMRLPDSCPAVVRLHVCMQKGAYAARNEGLRQARGRIIAFTDADCVIPPDWLENGLAAALQHGGRCLIGGEIEITVASTRPTAIELYQKIVGFSQSENISRLKFGATANLFLTREAVQAIGFFQEGLLSGGDREWCWRAESKGIDIAYVRDVRVAHPARNSLRDAVRQVRRVAGGRLALGNSAELCPDKSRLQPLRTAWQSVCWILSHSDLSFLQRVRVFLVAAFLKAVHAFEQLRVKAGGNPERR